MSRKSSHKSKYSVRNFSYSKTFDENERNIPGSIRFSVLFSGVVPFIGIIFTISGLAFLIPAVLGGIPLQFAIVSAIFPIIGLAFLYFTLRKRIKFLRIIRTGEFTYGTFQRYETTNVRINNAPVYRFFFSFNDANGNSFTATGDTHTGSLTDEPKELLAYNPDNPEEAVLIDIFPVSVKNYVLKLIEDEKETDVISEL